MPTYEYLCEKCEREFEREQRISDPPIRTCPYCRSRRVTKLISRTSFVLKGGGWYSDLYSSAKPGESSSGKEADGAAASTDASSAASSDSAKTDKPEKKKPESASKKKAGKGDSKRSKAPGKSAA